LFDPPQELLLRLGKRGTSPREALEVKLRQAEIRRKEFREWALSQQRRKFKVRSTYEHQRRQEHRSAKLQERLEQAASAHAAQVEERRSRAAYFLQRREGALARVQAKRESQAQRLQEQQRTAADRRLAIQAAERERLRQEHDLVLSRLSMSKEERSEQRRRLEERLLQAQEARSAHIHQRAHRAGEEVARARSAGALSRMRARRQAEERREKLSERLRSAAERRSQSCTPRASFHSPQLSPLSGVPSAHQSNNPAVVQSAAESAGGLQGVKDVVPEQQRVQQEQEEQALQLRVEGFRRHVSCRKLQQVWRNFCRKRRTTRALANAFAETGVTSVAPVTQPAAPECTAGSSAAAAPQPKSSGGGAASAPIMVGGLSSARAMPRGLDRFEAFASALRSPATIKAAQLLLRRLETRLAVRGMAGDSCYHLLRRLFPQGQRHQGHHHRRGSHGGSGGGAALERYPPRVFLCAWMVVKHPEVVFSSMGDREAQLASAAVQMTSAFEALLARILDAADTGASNYLAASPITSSMQAYHDALQKAVKAGAALPTTGGVGALLLGFDQAWLRYLDQFVAWKTEDAASLEAELIRMAAQMERSLRRKLQGSGAAGGVSPRARSLQDLQAMEEQVARDHGLLRERIAKLSGPAGLARLDAALQAAREAVATGYVSSEVSEAEPSQSDASAAEESEHEGGRARRGHVRASRAAAAASSGAAAPKGVPEVQVADEAVASTPAEQQQPAATEAQAPAATATAPTAAPLPRKSGLARGFFGAAKPAAKTANQAAAGEAAPPASSASQAQATAAASPASPRPPAPAHPAMPPGISPEAISNLAMVNDLLHEPNCQLPTSEAEAALQQAAVTGSAAPGSADAAAAVPTREPLVNPDEIQGMAPEQVVQLLQSRVKAAAERVFWQNVTSRLEMGLHAGSLLQQAVPLVSEVGRELAGVVSERSLAQQLAGEFEEQQLLDQLQSAGPHATDMPGSAQGLPGLLQVLERLAGLLLEYGAPARREDSLQAHKLMREGLTAAVAAYVTAQQLASSEGSEAESEARRTALKAATLQLAGSLSGALRVLLAQLKLLKLDSANARLGALSRQLQGDAGVQYVTDKFRALHRLGGNSNEAPAGEGVAAADSHPAESSVAGPVVVQELPRKLSRAAAWISNTHAAVPSMSQYCMSVGLDLDQAVAEAAAAPGGATGSTQPSTPAVPVTLRAGRAATLGGSSSTEVVAAAAAAVQPRLPVSLLSAAGLVRAGLVALVSGPNPAVGPMLAETLALEAERLHALQNQFQSLVVVTASFLLVQQLRTVYNPASMAQQQQQQQQAGAAAVPAQAAAAPWDRAAAKRRLQIVLADPSLQLQHLVTELASMVGLPSLGLPAEVQLRAESQLKSSLLRMVDPNSGAFRSLANGLSAALLAHMLTGGMGGQSGAARALGRIGATVVAEDLAALGSKLLKLAGVNEAVHLAEVYEPLFSWAVQQHQRQQQALEEQQQSGPVMAGAQELPVHLSE